VHKLTDHFSAEDNPLVPS